jgi:hypothetical protein
MLIKGYLHHAFSIAQQKTGRFNATSIAMDGASGICVVFVISDVDKSPKVG